MIEYKIGYEIIDWDSLMNLYYEVDGVIGLARQGKIDKIKKAFKGSYKIVTVWDDNMIIGAARLVSDGVCYGWVHDVGVLPSYQKKGIGKELMAELLKDNEELLIGLTSSFVAEDFYYKLGFKKHKTAMAKYPGKSTYLED